MLLIKWRRHPITRGQQVVTGRDIHIFRLRLPPLDGSRYWLAMHNIWRREVLSFDKQVLSGIESSKGDEHHGLIVLDTVSGT